jgi:tetratricopeptide (TPR) repeat protein
MPARLPLGLKVGRILLESERATQMPHKGVAGFPGERLRSAFAIGPEHVLTALHCTREATRMWFRLRTGGLGERRYAYLPLKLLNSNEDFDIAVLVVDESGLNTSGLSADGARRLLAEAAIPLGVDVALHERVRIMGFPANAPGADSDTLPAQVVDLTLPLGRVTGLKLVGESFAGTDPVDPHGLSGGPVLKSRGTEGDEVAVGVVRGLFSGRYTGVALGGGLVATRIEDVAERLPQVADALLTGVSGGSVPTGRVKQADVSLTALLRPDIALVEFFGRDQELRDLLAWCDGPADRAAWLITGPGGQGKTRLALQLCSELTATKAWATTLFNGAGDPAAVRDLCRRAACTGRPLLLVADYAAEYGAAAFAELVTALTGDARLPRWRLLLLARNNGDWWEPHSSGGSAAGVRSQLTRHGVEVPSAELALAPLVPDPLARETAVSRILAQLRPAVAAFAARHDLTVAYQPAAPDLSGADLGSALMLHVAAIVSLLPVAGQPLNPTDQPSASDLINRLLDLERERHWLYEDPATQRLYQPTQDAFGDLARGDCAIVETAVATATLVGAPTLWAAVQTVARALEIDQPRARNIARWLHDLYPPSGASAETGWLPPLQPDRLGEELVARVVRRQHAEGTPSDRLLPRCVLGSGPHSLTPAQIYRLLTVMIRMGSRDRGLADLLADAMRTPASQEAGGLDAAAAWDRYCQAIVAQYGHAKEPGWPPVVLWLSDRARECLAGEQENLLTAEAAGIELRCATNYLRCYRADRSRGALLTTSIQGLRALAGKLPDGHEVKPKALTNLSSALQDRFTSALALRTDLDDAITMASRAVDLSDPDDVWYASRINNLGGTRYSRYLRDGAISDLRQAVENQRKLLDENLVPTDHRAMVTNNLAEALRELFESTGDRATLLQAQQAHREAVRLAHRTPDTDLARILSGAGLTARTWQPTRRGIRQAIHLQQEALDLTSPDSTEWPNRLANLAWSWRMLAGTSQGTDALADADRAVTLFEQALAATPETAPRKAAMLQGRAEAIEQRWRQTKDPDDLQAALTGYSDSLIGAVPRSPVGAPAAACSAGRLAAEAGDLGAALAFFEHGLTAVDRLLAGQGTDADKNSILRQANDLLRAACAAYVRAGQHENAAAILNRYTSRS